MDQPRPSASPGGAEHIDDPLIGRRLGGKFLIERQVGSGAMGIVYRARQLALEKVVAIKVMRAEHAATGSLAARFAREARAASRLDHPNSIRILDFGVETDGLLYIAMEFVEGRDLGKLIVERGPLATEVTIGIVGQILSALAVAHEQGVLHRDLKPENIMLVPGVDDEGAPIEVVKVCDFGIAKIRDASSTDPDSGAAANRLTQGVIIGTPAYMSPEQASGHAVDARSDLYSVGVMLYEMLTGSAPFNGESALAVIVKHVHEEPVAPSQRVPSVDVELEAMCLRAMRKNPSERYQSARDMRAALSGRFSSQAPAVASRSQGSQRLVVPVVPLAPGADERPAPSRSGARPAGRRAGWAVFAAAAAAGVLGIGAAWAVHRVPASSAAPVATLSSATSTEPEEAPSRAAVLEPSPSDRLSNPVEAPPAPAPVPLPLPPPRRSVAHALPLNSASPPSAPAALPAADDTPAATPPTAVEAPPAPAPSPVAAPSAAPPVATPVMIAPSAPTYDATLARVEVGSAAAVAGSTAASVNHAMAGIAPILTACYRALLPRMAGPLEGTATLHVETDGEGLVDEAHLWGSLDPRLRPCIEAAARARRIPNVDTGSARADLPLTFRSH